MCEKRCLIEICNRRTIVYLNNYLSCTDYCRGVYNESCTTVIDSSGLKAAAKYCVGKKNLYKVSFAHTSVLQMIYNNHFLTIRWTIGCTQV